MDLHPKCHLSTKTSSKQNLRQVISKLQGLFKDYFESPWEAIMQW
jgi:hypothetical protein